MFIEIEAAKTPEQFTEGARLIRAYAGFLGHDLEFQGFSRELDSIPSMYGPPVGALLLAKAEDGYVGVVGLREFQPGIAEMKRMFVLAEYHGRGVGKALTGAFLRKAKEMGYRKVWLDSIPELDKALSLYRAFGFSDIEPYRFNPHPEAVFMEYNLS